MILIPSKVRLLSVGISEYMPFRSDLSAPLNDAPRIYDAFEDVLGPSLDHRHSIVALNITGDQFLAHMRTALKEGQKSASNDLFIIYFSGHGTTFDDVLDLHFVDSATGQGSVSSTVIGEMLRMFQYPRVLLVLDCCFSGAAKSITQTHTGLNKKKTTLIASSQPYQPSKVGTPLSIFTGHLCTSLYKIKQHGSDISVANLALELHNCDLQGQLPHIVFPENELNLVLASPLLSGSQAQQLQTDIAERLLAANEGVRESIWYALAEEPEYVLLGVANILFHPKNYVDPSWLVRRAAGSALSQIKFLKNEQASLCDQLLGSNDWSNRCIGILIIRHLLSTGDYCARLETLLQSADEPMDVRWLALLYLSDHYKSSSFAQLIQKFTLHEFYQSAWGVCELWELCVNKPSTSEDIPEIIERTQSLIKNSAHCASALVTLIYFRKRKIFDGLGAELQQHLDRALVGTTGISSLLDTATRGSRQTSGVGKWLHSSLYGSWRGTYRPLSVFDKLNFQELAKFLEAARNVPIVAARMAIFEQLEAKPAIASQHIDSLSWGLADAHPWVRRVATRLFKTVCAEKSFEENKARIYAAASPTVGTLHPGRLDHLREILHWANQLALPQEAINKLLHDTLQSLSGCDRFALNRECFFESRPYQF